MSTPRTHWTIALLVASLLLNGYLAYRLGRYHQADLARGAKRTDRVDARNELFKGLPMDTSDIVLLGDSHFEYLPANELFPEKSIRNRGLSGQTAAEVRARIGPIVTAHPRQVFLLAGVNDIFHGRTQQDYSSDMAAILDAFTAQGIPIVVLGLLPNSSVSVQQQIDAWNEALRKLCVERKVPYVDVDGPFKSNGSLDPSLTYDGLHLNAQGNLLLARVMQPMLR